MLDPWISFSIKAWQLGFEVQSVIALRLMRMAAGGARADAEANRILSEKTAAAGEAQLAVTTAVMRGRKDHVVAGKALAVYSKPVHAKKRRLSRR